MILLSVRGIQKHFGPDPVLADVTFDLRAGDRASLVGPNGVGKTTLLNILAGAEGDAGSIDKSASTKIGFLRQHHEFETERTVWDETRSALDELIAMTARAEELGQAIEAATDPAERDRLTHRFDALQQQLLQHDAYNLDHRIEKVLSGLGFTSGEYEQPVQQLSGGQQNRLMLAKLLLAEPDLLLLDEPSNHLDIEATSWLEDFLSQSRQAMIIVSHDRFFLDKVTNRTLELYQGTVDSYPGNFSAYLRQKAERLEVQRRTYEKQQIEIAKLEDFIRKHHHGQKHLQAEDRRKKLERIERVEPPREIPTSPMGFPPAARSGDIVVRSEHLSKAFDRPLFEDLTFDILRGEKWGILGPNGCGKTTLLRCLLGEQEADQGKVHLGVGIKIAYFDQLLSSLNHEDEAVEAVRPDHKEFNEPQRRDLLARFGITGDMAFQRIRSLSGGERNRVALALLAAADANVLVLDEPTNHLDLWACDALEKSLRKFDGTVLFVSHDRYFINQVADKLLVADARGFRVIEGNYDTYSYMVQQGIVASDTEVRRAAEPQAVEDKKPSPSNDTKPKAKRKRKFPYRKLPDLEADIAQCESRIEELHLLLASPEVLRDGDRVKESKSELDQTQATLSQLYEHWEEAVELN